MEGPSIAFFFGAAGVLMVVVAAVGTYYIAKLIANAVRKSQAAKLEAQARENEDRLKSLMIQRGMSAAEIERVLNARGARTDFAQVADDAQARIVRAMSDNGYASEEIERVLRAARPAEGPIPPVVGQLVEALADDRADSTAIERVLGVCCEAKPA
jgi:chromosome segregation ATPase